MRRLRRMEARHRLRLKLVPATAIHAAHNPTRGARACSARGGRGGGADAGAPDDQRRGPRRRRVEGHRVAPPERPQRPADAGPLGARRRGDPGARLPAEPGGARAQARPFAPGRAGRRRRDQPVFGGRAARRRSGVPRRRLHGAAVQRRQRRRARARGDSGAGRLPGRGLHRARAQRRRRRARCGGTAQQAGGARRPSPGRRSNAV